MENFSGTYPCRFCTAEEKIQTTQVSSGTFCRRTEAIHNAHLEAIRLNDLPSDGVISEKCVISERLSHFNVITGFPPDIMHDLFEGIVPRDSIVHDCVNIYKI